MGADEVPGEAHTIPGSSEISVRERGTAAGAFQTAIMHQSKHPRRPSSSIPIQQPFKPSERSHCNFSCKKFLRIIIPSNQRSLLTQKCNNFLAPIL